VKVDERRKPSTDASLPSQPVSQWQALEDLNDLDILLERARALQALLLDSELPA
jgi:hypothetical protein